MNCKFLFVGFAALCTAITIPVQPVHAQTDTALLDALVKKGVLSDQERQDIEAQDLKEYNTTAASKINLASSIKSITFYGDLRLRYELRDGTTPAGYTGQRRRPPGQPRQPGPQCVALSPAFWREGQPV